MSSRGERMCGDEREGETERTCGRDGKIETGTPQVRETGKEVTGYMLANRRKEFIHTGEDSGKSRN